MGKFKKVVSIILLIVLVFSNVSVYASTSGADYVTREEAVAMLLDTIGLGTLNETVNDLTSFHDAAEVDAKYADKIGIAVTNNILVGNNSRILPKDYITRIELAMVISRSIRELPDIKPVETFSDLTQSQAVTVNRLIKAGLMYGYGNGLFGANDYVTRDQLSAILSRISNLSNTRPQDDFYYAMNYKWLTSTRLPDGYPSYTAFDEVNLSNTNRLKEIVNDVVSKADQWKTGSKEQKMAALYSTIMDVENRNKQGFEPIKQYLDAIDNVLSVKELLSLSATMEEKTGLNPLFTFSPSVDLVDSTRYSLYGTGITTELPAAYLTSGNQQVEALYQGFISELFKLCGEDEAGASEVAKTILDFEKLMAQHTMSNELASKVENIYNPYDIDELAKLFPEVDLKAYLAQLGYRDVKTIVVTDPGLMEKTGAILSDENIDTLKVYAKYRVIVNTASYLSKDLENALIVFNSTFLGIGSTISEEDKAFTLINAVMGNYLGKIYVEKYFTEEAKKDVESIVKEIIGVYRKRIENLDWMSETTKKAAIKKLNATKLKIGYPDNWPDPLANISLKTYEEGNSLLDNIFAVTSVVVNESKKVLTEKVDKSRWIVPPHTVNAFYNHTSNEIIFPAGILQPPFYDVNASREQNLGGIGTIIAHEITHAFDNNGAQFDENGNMSNWWTLEDYETFQQKCQAIIDLYNVEIGPDAVVSGALTLSENVADIGAMACILEIAKTIPNVDYEELFESYANIWRQTATSAMYSLLTVQDTHAPNKLRVNQVLRIFQEFYDTYDVTPDDVMYLAPEKRVTIW